jgi:hypothetical protein
MAGAGARRSGFDQSFEVGDLSGDHLKVRVRPLGNLRALVAELPPYRSHAHSLSDFLRESCFSPTDGYIAHGGGPDQPCRRDMSIRVARSLERQFRVIP